MRSSSRLQLIFFPTAPRSMNFSSGWPSRCATWAANRLSFAPVKSKASPIKNLSIFSMRRASGSMRPFFTRFANYRRRKNRRAGFGGELEKQKKEFHRIREIDFFDSPRAQDVEGLLQRIHASRDGKKIPAARLFTKHYRKKMWVTRPRPEIDRVASAWLIRRFIDPQAKFVFAKNATAIPRALPFDFSEGEFSHHGDDCTFETLLVRFRIMDKALRKIGEMVHDADLEDEKFKRSECIGIDRVLKGWAKQGMSDHELLAQGARCFDGLYAALQRL